MPREPANFLSGGHVPQTERAVHAARGQGLAVWGQRQAKGTVLMASEPAEFLARGQVPEGYVGGLIVRPACRDDSLSVRTEDRGADLPLVTSDLPEFSARGRVPQAERL